MYKNVTYCILNNRWKSNNFTPTRSLKQGCPLSSLLLLLVAEIMALKIRRSDQINGIQIHKEPHKSVKLTHLADDTTLFLKHDNDIINALHLVD